MHKTKHFKNKIAEIIQDYKVICKNNFMNILLYAAKVWNLFKYLNP